MALTISGLVLLGLVLAALVLILGSLGDYIERREKSILHHFLHKLLKKRKSHSSRA